MKENQTKEEPIDFQRAAEIKIIPDITDLKRAKTDPIPKIKEETARALAVILVVGFLILLTVPYVFLASGNVTAVIDLMKTVAALLSGLVGAVFGYYFRRGGES